MNEAEETIQKKVCLGQTARRQVLACDYKDLLVAFALFIVLILLATFVGVANEPKADPSDSNYIPRPEWYFLFLYEMLKFFPGSLEVVGTFILPVIAVLVLILLPFLDRNPDRYFGKRKVANAAMYPIYVRFLKATLYSTRHR